ncbi:MAG: DUF502 domain-containing protein [Candidatus Omnitrophota bacterium]
MLVKFRNYFITGIAAIVPILATFIIMRFLIVEVNRWVLNPLIKFLRPYLGGVYVLSAAKIGIFIITIWLIYVIGWAADKIVIRKFFVIWERIFIKVPMVGRIYSVIRQISSAFLGHGKTIFRNVVLLEYPRKGLYSIGFVTGEGKVSMTKRPNEEFFSVFVPTTPNPTSGIFLVTPRSEIKFLSMSVEDGMKLVISGGAVASPFEEIEA